MPDAAIAFINTAGVCCAIMPIVKGSGIKLNNLANERKHRRNKQIGDDNRTESKQDDNGELCSNQFLSINRVYK